MDEVLVTVLLHGAREVTAAAAGGVLKRSLRQPLARDCTVGMILPDVITLRHGGELATKVGYFGIKSTNVLREQMGTKPAKLGRLQSLGVNSAKKYFGSAQQFSKETTFAKKNLLKPD